MDSLGRLHLRCNSSHSRLQKLTGERYGNASHLTAATMPQLFAVFGLRHFATPIRLR